MMWNELPIRSYLLGRKIKESVLNELVDRKLLTLDRDKARFPMRDFMGRYRGYKSRNLFGYLKERNVSGSNVGYMYMDELLINSTNAPLGLLIICEGMPDFLTLVEHTTNVVGLPSINQLCNCIRDLRKFNLVNGNTKIVLLTDLDEAGNDWVEKLKKESKVDLSNVFDCRGYFCPRKDINDFVMHGGNLDIGDIITNYMTHLV